MDENAKERFDDHEERIRYLEEKTIRNDILTQTCTKAFEKLDNTMDSIAIIMTKMEGSINSLSEKVDGSEKKIVAIGKKVDALEEKGKFDYQQWVKDNFTKVIIVIILAALAFPQFAQIIKSVF